MCLRVLLIVPAAGRAVPVGRILRAIAQPTGMLLKYSLHISQNQTG